MGAEGFEPSKAEPSDLQSDPFVHFGTRPTFFVHRLNLREIRCFQPTSAILQDRFSIRQPFASVTPPPNSGHWRTMRQNRIAPKMPT
jgi:hypothetical protein